MSKLWGGRFTKDTSSLVEAFHSSIAFDRRLYAQDIAGSIAHAVVLGEQGIIAQDEAAAIVAGLEGILADLRAGTVELDPAAEDIHMNVEQMLIDRLGPVGKKLHTGRSRNDQVALDLRLYLRDEIKETQRLILQLLDVLLTLAEQHATTIMPGYTHLQRAQPITFGHHLLAYVAMLRRDFERLSDAQKRTNVCPLGAGALAGTTYNLAPARVAELLGFPEVAQNSLDAVSDRDFVIEFCAAASLLMMHLSRLSEEIVLWSSSEFGFVELDDSYSTGSSIMPQKKNPDVAELVRGKTGRVYGGLVAGLTQMKGLPLSYNKDMQEDKEALFDVADTVKGCLSVYAPMLAGMTVKRDRLREAAEGGYINATDLADYLAKRGVPFREAHAIVGKAVLHAISAGKNLTELDLTQYRQWCPTFDADLYTALELETCVNHRLVAGGPAPQTTRDTVATVRAWMAAQSNGG